MPQYVVSGIMDDFPKNLTEFRERFSTEELCIDYLIALRWPNGFECPICGNNKMRRTTRGLFECQKCLRQTSVTAGTLFHDTRKPLRLWFEAMWHITNQKYGANALGLQRVLGLGSYHTAWQWLHRLRRAMVRPGRDKLSGTVEIDETYIGGERSGKRGRGADNKALVAVAIEDKSKESTTGKGIGRIRLQLIPNASAESLNDFIKANVNEGSCIRTDGWSGYHSVSTIGYEHVVANSMDLKIAHLSISLLKRWLLGTYQGAVNSTHLSYYLDEFTFRFNRRTSGSRGQLFYRLLQQSLLSDPVPCKEIVGGKAAHASTISENVGNLQDIPF
jgi:transposase-like protein